MLILELLYGTGIRISELITLKSINVNMTKKEIKVFGKRNKERIIPIHEQIISQIKKYTNKKIGFSFNPHLIPTFRGLLSCIYVNVKKGKTGSSLRKSLLKFYASSKFIKILKSMDSPNFVVQFFLIIGSKLLIVSAFNKLVFSGSFLYLLDFINPLPQYP